MFWQISESVIAKPTIAFASSLSSLEDLLRLLLDAADDIVHVVALRDGVISSSTFAVGMPARFG